MKGLVNVYKKRGETPLETLGRLKERYPKYALSRMTYAGRLDPLAEGVLLVLMGEKVHEKETYLALHKTYEVEILVGVGTDSFDLMGVIEGVGKDTERGEIEKALMPEVGERDRAYPPFSSKPVDGKPLFMHARRKSLTQEMLPKRRSTIEKIEIAGWSVVSGENVARVAEREIAKVSGDFRQEEIIRGWKDFSRQYGSRSFAVVRLVVSCGSGVYMRSLADQVGKSVKTPCLAFSIIRTRVGRYTIQDALLKE